MVFCEVEVIVFSLRPALTFQAGRLEALLRQGTVKLISSKWIIARAELGEVHALRVPSNRCRPNLFAVAQQDVSIKLTY